MFCTALLKWRFSVWLFIVIDSYRSYVYLCSFHNLFCIIQQHSHVFCHLEPALYYYYNCLVDCKLLLLPVWLFGQLHYSVKTPQFTIVYMCNFYTLHTMKKHHEMSGLPLLPSFSKLPIPTPKNYTSESHATLATSCKAIRHDCLRQYNLLLLKEKCGI